MKRFETSIQADDLMVQSQKKGAYAKERILAHLPQYGLFTLKRHPRLYGGTGTVALFRYLGLERICNCLDVSCGVPACLAETLSTRTALTRVRRKRLGRASKSFRG